MVEPLLPTRRLFKQKTCFEITVVMGKVKDTCNICLEELSKTGNLIPESRNDIILGIRKKSGSGIRMDQVGQLGVPTSWLSPYYQREDYSSRRPVSRLLLRWARWKMKFGGSDQDWQFNPRKEKLRYIGNREEVRDGSSWSARSSHFVVEPLLPTRSLFKQKTCFKITVAMGKVKDEVWSFWSRLAI